MTELPPLLFVADLAALLGIGEAAIRKQLGRGELGPYLRIGRRLAVRREAFLATLEAREVTPDPPAAIHRLASKDTGLREKLKRQGRTANRSASPGP